ncbi:hypothetical protein DH2020_043358 [Rehmannia glutinosa]|uniref:Uncharacterized protein n=1 Tax=Rehmannia glutinosa TaxID=99300 RepID=A0ABR0UL18_REHGL
MYLNFSARTLHQLETKLNQFVDYGREALDDLRTVVSVDGNNGRVLISCRRSTVEFFLALFLSSFVVLIAFRGLFKVRKNGGEALIYKRDRSLGGREVVVGKSETNWSSSRKSTPLSSDNSNYYYQKKNNRTRTLGRRRKEELPQWWPQVVNWDSQETVNKEEYQRMANQLIRAIMDRKMSGQDISTNDIVQLSMARRRWSLRLIASQARRFTQACAQAQSAQAPGLRHLCKTYGVRTFINTANARDSLYRVSVNFVLDYCERYISISNDSTSIQINGEDVRSSLLGLLITLDLRALMPQEWYLQLSLLAHGQKSFRLGCALEVQNKHAEALAELFKVCLIHRIFPPEENSVRLCLLFAVQTSVICLFSSYKYFLLRLCTISISLSSGPVFSLLAPEMEMVARGLDKSLSVEQREYILNSFISVCGKDIDQSLLEALGLGGAKDEQGYQHV